MMTIRGKLITAFSIIVVLILVVFLVIVFLRSDRSTPQPQLTEPIPVAPPEERAPVETAEPRPARTTTQVIPVTEMPPEERFVEQATRIFVERFRSFSNQNNNAHIESVRELVTTRMWRYADSQRIAQEVIYSGQTTNVITLDIDTLTDSEAIVSIGIQEVRDGASGQVVEYRDGRVELVKQADTWLVDGLFFD